jgi:ADP-ribosylglycohydrolase
MSKPDLDRRTKRTVGSALWAAWADALGFISELTNDAGLRRRLRGRPLTEPLEWTRRVGGKFGADMVLPAGCYSDDTQLRLATSRAVHGRGFDVEAFARIELPVWPSYALGGGRACKAASANLAKPTTPWFGNFFDGWLDAGGNGVAMRIQPHVWAAPQPATLGQHVLDVIVNGVTSHGHPRALVGAVLHALSLGATLDEGHVPLPDRWPELLESTQQVVKLIDENQQLASLWRPTWESHTGILFADAWERTVDECRNMLDVAIPAVLQLSAPEGRLSDTAHAAYGTLVTAFSLRDPSTRGNGIATAITALALAAAAPADPVGVSQLAAQTIGTDTDTIATMAAALIGASDTAPRPPQVLDMPYLTAEASRLAMIASGQATQPFSYPDLLHWSPPHTQVDAVGMAGGLPALAGLGWLTPVEDRKPVEIRGTLWTWTHSDFGPSFLVKQRTALRDLPEGNWPVRRERLVAPRIRHAAQEKLPTQQEMPYETRGMQATVVRSAETSDQSSSARNPSVPPAEHEPVNIDHMLTWVARRGYDETAIGYAIRRISEIGTVEQLVAFTTTLRARISEYRPY